MAVHHGGNLIQIAKKYNSDVADWVDLSTGVSPNSYPVGNIPQQAWQRLPESDDGLESAAQSYYQAPVTPIAVSGSQAAIMALPAILARSMGRCGVVALPSVGYKEHEHAWRSYSENGQRWSITFYQHQPSEKQIAESDALVIINPNNPTGFCASFDDLHQIRAKLAERGATLILDEAFIDTTPEQSLLAPSTEMEGLVVLRSVGKFFGLAGARVGFLFSYPKLAELLKEHLGPWTVNGPSRWLVKQALQDTAWQQQARKEIIQSGSRLKELLKEYLDYPISGAYLFATVQLPDAEQIHHLLCQRKVLTRLCDEKNAIRFGIPKDASQWQVLQQALTEIKQQMEVTL